MIFSAKLINLRALLVNDAASVVPHGDVLLGHDAGDDGSVLQDQLLHLLVALDLIGVEHLRQLLPVRAHQGVGIAGSSEIEQNIGW